MARVALYTRVSTDSQTTENQQRELERVAQQRGWELIKVYTDHRISGAKGRDQRPAFDRLIGDATRAKFDIVAAWSVDRLGRSLKDLLGFLTELHALGVGLYLHQQAVDTTTPAGKALFQMMGVFAEFERAMIRERVVAGLARAKANGVRLGRPKLTTEMEERVRAQLAKGTGIIKTGRLLGVGTGTVQRIKRQTKTKRSSRRPSRPAQARA
jgi:DNA invertase Pin-like site-specific DNA recombinase